MSTFVHKVAVGFTQTTYAVALLYERKRESVLLCVSFQVNGDRPLKDNDIIARGEEIAKDDWERCCKGRVFSEYKRTLYNYATNVIKLA